MPSIVCGECRTLISNPYEQYSERLEYRRLDCKERPLSRTLRLVCRECVERFKAEANHTDGVEQGSLFG